MVALLRKILNMSKKKTSKDEDKRARCKECGGVGFNEETEKSCPKCDGSGRVN